MNFYCDSTGSIIHEDPEQIYQGSANVNALNFIGAFPANAKVLVQYQLPNKRWTAPQLMAYNSVLSGVQDVQGNAYNVWHAMLGSRFDGEKFVPDFLITENYGTVKIQFQVIMSNGDGEPTTLAVAESAFEVLKTNVHRENVSYDGYNALIQQVLSELTKANQSKYISEINLVRSETALDIYRIVYNDNSFTEFSINKTFVASTGAAILKTEFVGVDQATGGYKYRQTYDNGTIAYFVAPPGSAGPEGPEGPAGPQGATGAKINSITFKRLVEGTVEGALYEMEFDNGVKAEFVAPKGPQGDTGRDGQDGEEGKSAYQVWLDTHEGSQETFFEFLKGPPGESGKSAYQIWLEQGNTGTEEEFLTELKGTPGAPGTPGSPGPKGDTGPSGVYTLSEGEDFDDVPDGYNVVIAELGVDDGTVLQGPQGPKGDTGATGATGPQGPAGSNGKDGVGISKAEINANGELVLTYTNGNSVNLGKVVGANGTPGNDGVGIVNVTLEGGNLKVTLTNGTVIDLGNVKGANGENGEDGDSVASATINENGELVLTFVSGKELVVGDIVGEDGKDGKNGVGISKAEINSNGQLVITYTNETTTNLGKVVGAKGQDGKDGQDGQDGDDGFSPTVTVEEITGGHRVTITDKSGPQEFDVLNGKDGTGGSGSGDGSVDLTGVLTYTKQTLTKTEQLQARKNIDAAAGLPVVINSCAGVKYDGNIGNKEKIGDIDYEIGMFFGYVHITEEVLPVTESQEWFLVLAVAEDGVMQNQMITEVKTFEPLIEDIYCINADLSGEPTPIVIVVPYDNYYIDELVSFPKKGVYFLQVLPILTVLSLYSPTYFHNRAPNGVIINSSTEGSSKKFKITVDDSGTISATEVA